MPVIRPSIKKALLAGCIVVLLHAALVVWVFLIVTSDQASSGEARMLWVLPMILDWPVLGVSIWLFGFRFGGVGDPTDMEYLVALLTLGTIQWCVVSGVASFLLRWRGKHLGSGHH